MLDGYLDIQRMMSKLTLKRKSFVCIILTLFYVSYFTLLAKELSGRLEEYKKCIWEIERTAESWTHSRVQSPQGKVW
jgi:hypothetical protein